MRYWHNRLNVELFGSRLTKIRLQYGDSTGVFKSPVWGYYHGSEQDCHIHIDANVNTKLMLVNVLAHEMVHQLQHQLDKPVTHGRFFKSQAKRLLKHGIIL